MNTDKFMKRKIQLGFMLIIALVILVLAGIFWGGGGAVTAVLLYIMSIAGVGGFLPQFDDED